MEVVAHLQQGAIMFDKHITLCHSPNGLPTEKIKRPKCNVTLVTK